MFRRTERERRGSQWKQLQIKMDGLRGVEPTYIIVWGHDFAPNVRAFDQARVIKQFYLNHADPLE